MSESFKKTDELPVVTLRTLLDADGVEAPVEAVRAPVVADGVSAVGGHGQDPVARYNRVVALLTQATQEAGSEVFVTVQDRDASVLQSSIAALRAENAALTPGGVEAKFGDGPTGGDVWGWIRSVFDHRPSWDWHDIIRPPDGTPHAFADAGRIAVLSDWGTNLYGAPVSAATIGAIGGYEMLMHLGDVYYSGTETEMQERFLQVWPMHAGKVNRALNGNHEMYSGGYAYFDHLLPAFGQDASYFAVQNAHWVLAGLDTAHSDHDLDTKQVAWLQSLVQGAGGRKLVLFSHHQPFSRLDKQGPKLQTALAALLDARAITAWYWGHEHNCVLYDRHPRFGLLGRCIGNGGIPAPRTAEVMGAPTERTAVNVAWKRLAPSAEAPSCLVLDGPNPLVPGEEQKFGPHGYVTLEFAGPDLTERVHLPDGTEIWRGKVG